LHYIEFVTERIDAAGFAPSDPLDGRSPLEWQSKYEPGAKNEIRKEAGYLGALLAIIPVALFVVWLEFPKVWFGIPPEKYPSFARFSASWLSGTLGGTLFAIKWLYHTVARRIWHLDRRLWRLFTPHISGGLSFSVFALISSGIVRVFDRTALHSLPAIVGVGFLVGYFSDSAIAKLSEVAETLFGASRLKAETPKHLPDGTGR
jgi:hypothetical protein